MESFCAYMVEDCLFQFARFSCMIGSYKETQIQVPGCRKTCSAVTMLPINACHYSLLLLPESPRIRNGLGTFGLLWGIACSAFDRITAWAFRKRMCPRSMAEAGRKGKRQEISLRKCFKMPQGVKRKCGNRIRVSLNLSESVHRAAL